MGGASCQTACHLFSSAQQLCDDTAWMPVRVALKRRYVRQETSLTVLPVSSCTLSHVDMSALLLKLQTEREKREALEHEVDIIKRRLEERSVVQSAADYKQTLFSEMLHVQLYLRTGTEATHRQYSEGCLLPHVPSFPCNSHS